MGKLELSLLEPRIPRPADVDEGKKEKPWYAQQKLRVIADSIPLQAVALALSEALGLNVDVEAEAAPVRVFVYYPEATVSDLLEAVQRQSSLHVRFNASAMSLERVETWLAHQRNFVEYERLRIRILRMTGSVSAREFAAVFCRDLASARGTATAVGDLVILKDDLDALARAEGTKLRLENPEACAKAARSSDLRPD